MMQVMTDQEMIAWARAKWPLYPEAGEETRTQREVIHALCDALEKRLTPKPVHRTWEGVWGMFDKRQKAREDDQAGR